MSESKQQKQPDSESPQNSTNKVGPNRSPFLWTISAILSLLVAVVFFFIPWVSKKMDVSVFWTFLSFALALAIAAAFGLFPSFKRWLDDFFAGNETKEDKDFRRTIWFFSFAIIIPLIAAISYQTCCETCESPTPFAETNSVSVLDSNKTLLTLSNSPSGTNLEKASTVLTNLPKSNDLQGRIPVGATNRINGNHAEQEHGLKSRRVQHSVTILLWSLACLACGSFAGFLFGIPKVFQSEGQRKDSKEKDDKGKVEIEEDRYRQQVNTNLTEISDWITKIIVGLGLINLKLIPGKIIAAAETFAGSLKGCGNPSEHVAFGIAVILFFSVMGFLFGYLMTRLFLAAAFSRADTGQTRVKLAAKEAEVGQLETDRSYLSRSDSITVRALSP